MLDEQLVQQLRAHLANLKSPVHVVASLDSSPKSAEMSELLGQLNELSDLITIDLHGDDLRRPSFSIAGAGDTAPRVRFGGVPLGHEFTSLVLTLLWAGGHPPRETAETMEAIATIEGPLHFETYMSLSCQNCPDVVQALSLIALFNPTVTHTAIDGGVFPDEVAERNVLAVPSVFLNGEPFDQGRMTLAQILNRLDSGAAARTADAMSAEAPFDVLVVGGGPAGAAAAVYAARKGIRTAVVAERFGGQVGDTIGIENLISVPYTEGPKLVSALEAHVAQYDVDVHRDQRAVALHPLGSADPEFHVVELASGARLRARTVVLSTGASWRHLGVEGEDEYRNKGVTFCPHCDGPLFKDKRVAVIGGGNSGIEAAVDLAGIVGHVTVVEFDDQLRADAVLQRALAGFDNTTVITSAATTSINGDGDQVTGLAYQDRASGESHEVALDGVFVQIGLVPNTAWLGDSIELSPRGEIVIDDRGATSVPGIYAAGDCTTTPYKQIVVALGGGATAALSAFDHLIRTGASSSAVVAPVPA